MASRAFHSPSLRPTLVTAGRRWLTAPAAAAAIGLLLAGGCDSPQGKADKAVDEKVSAAVPMMTGATADEMAASKALGEAAADANLGSKWQQVSVKSLQGDSELRMAQDVAARIAFYDDQVGRLTVALDGMAEVVGATNGAVAGMQKSKPDVALAALGKQSADLTGSEAKPDWVRTSAGSIESLAADDKVAAEGAAEVDRLQASIKSETDDRDKQLAAGDQLDDQSARERGDKSVDLYTQAAAARKQAADLNVKIDADTIALGRAQADLDAVRQQQEAKRAALAQFATAKSAVDANWRAVQGRMKASKSDATKLLGDAATTPPGDVPKPLTLTSTVADVPKLPPGTGPTVPISPPFGGTTIRSKAAMLAALEKQVRELRVDAEKHYNGALGFYREAADAADKLQAELNTRMAVIGPEKMDFAALTGMAETLHPSRYHYLFAAAELNKAEYFARSAAAVTDQLDTAGRLKAALDADGLEVPAGLDESAVTDLTGRQANAMKAARDGFRDAAKDLGPLSEGGGGAPKEVRDAATAAALFDHYSWAQLETMPGGSAADAKAQLDQARSLAGQVPELTFTPPLPPGLTPAATPAQTPVSTPAPKPPRAR